VTSPSPTRTRRPRARKGEGDRLHDEIIEAAEHLLIETGSEDAVSIRAVADAIGVTPPAIYRHFDDKAHLLFDVCARHFERMDAFVLAATRDIEDPVEQLCQRARAYVRFGVENPEHYRIMFMGRSEITPEQYADEMVVETGSFAHMVQCVQRCLDAGRFRDGLPDAFTLTFALWSAVHGVTSLLVAKPNMPGPDAETLVDLLLDIQLRGVLAP
jgi:AcrR family transcriptional regulator